ncbi:MAG: hypothetical protein VB046_06890 [Paludibacter sp.]|nr:hypothetical protein [Paludibacter sp.]
MAKKIYDPYLKFGLNNNPDAKADLVGGKVPSNQSQVSSVSGKKGDVALNKYDVGLSNVNNTSDPDKPISTAASVEFANKQAQIDLLFKFTDEFLCSDDYELVLTDDLDFILTV